MTSISREVAARASLRPQRALSILGRMWLGRAGLRSRARSRLQVAARRGSGVALVGVLLVGCGGTSKTSGNSDDPGGGAVGGSGGASGSAGKSGSGGSDSITPALASCDDPPPTFGSCASGSQCAEGNNDFAASVTRSICNPQLGFLPSTEQCTDFQLIGRCYEPQPGVWRSFYNTGGGQADIAAAKQRCDSAKGRWCTNPATIPSEVANACVEACNAARPDYTDEPECRMADSCNNACWDRLTALTVPCAECVAAGMIWPAGHCNDFECLCSPPQLSGACSAACGG